MGRPRFLVLSSLAIAGATVLAACGGDDAKLVVYSGRAESLIGPLLADFTDDTGIEVEVKYGQSADMALLLEEELAAGKSDVDVFISQSPGAIGYLENNARLAELPQEILDLEPPNVRDDEGRWVGLSGRERVIVYNTELVDPADLPSSVLDLTASAWSGRIGIAPSNGSFQDFVTAMRVTEGDEVTMSFLEGLAANDPLTYANNNAIVEAVARGEVEIGLVNHYYNYRRLVEVPDSPTANHRLAEGDPGSLLIVSGAAVVEGTDMSDDAERLVQWLLGEQAQTYFAAETFEYPLANGTSPVGDVPAIEFASVGGIDFTALGDGLEVTRDMILAAGLDG
jgi:iron(III) transport system substrate-binding protein